MMAGICTRPGIERPFGFHSIRHFVMSLLNDSGKASLKQLQEMAGHKRQSTTEMYHSLGHPLREAATLLDQNLEDFLKVPRWSPTLKRFIGKGWGS